MYVYNTFYCNWINLHIYLRLQVRVTENITRNDYSLEQSKINQNQFSQTDTDLDMSSISR